MSISYSFDSFNTFPSSIFSSSIHFSVISFDSFMRSRIDLRISSGISFPQIFISFCKSFFNHSSHFEASILLKSDIISFFVSPELSFFKVSTILSSRSFFSFSFKIPVSGIFCF
ncbi:TPA: hypothetical protein DCZ31_04115 [Patescibacteria group bacterium]|nr:hypothetical protein [Candidatus Gracilibacteria bacterium]